MWFQQTVYPFSVTLSEGGSISRLAGGLPNFGSDNAHNLDRAEVPLLFTTSLAAVLQSCSLAAFLQPFLQTFPTAPKLVNSKHHLHDGITLLVSWQHSRSSLPDIKKDSVASGHLIANNIGMFITTMGNYHFLVTAEITLKPLARYLLSVCPSIVPGAIAARAAQLRGPPAWLRYCSSRQHPIIASSKLGNATLNTGDETTRKLTSTYQSTKLGASRYQEATQIEWRKPLISLDSRCPERLQQEDVILHPSTWQPWHHRIRTPFSAIHVVDQREQVLASCRY